jgi:hypothetical protein
VITCSGCGGRRDFEPALFGQPVLAGKICAAGMRQMWPPDLGDSRDNLPGHAQATDRLVSRHVLGYDPEERGQRTGAPAGARTKELQDRLDLAAQVASRDGCGQAGTG